MGKSSLMINTAAELKKSGVLTAVVDVSVLGTNITSRQWYLGFLLMINQELKLGINQFEWWSEHQDSSPVQCFTRFVQHEVLGRKQGPIVIFVDEIDSTLMLPFTDDFFASIRSMYNDRAASPEYERLTFVLVGVARPADLIKDRLQTPYNIGRAVELDDFNVKDAEPLLSELERLYPGQSQAILERVFYWTGGHPYLTQRICAEIAETGSENDRWADGQIDRVIERLFLQEEQIQRESNLQWLDEHILGSKYRDRMLRIYREILSGRQVKDEERSIEKSLLKLSGLVKASPEGYLQVRNRIYEGVFTPEWVRRSSPGILERMLVFFGKRR
jgi:hypothetical protein